jgi:hypothetical protein
MSQGVKAATLKKAIALLSVLQTEFIIKTQEGDLYTLGDLVLADTTKKKRALSAPRGTHKDFLIAAGLDAMQIGDVIMVHQKQFDRDSVQRRISSRACSLWGTGSVMTTCVKDGVEVLRIN